MGKQVRFFITMEDELILLEKVLKDGYLILNDMGNIFNAQEAIVSNEFSLYFTFYNSNIIKIGEFIEQIESEVIQFSRCRKFNENTFEPSRIWAEFKYWNSQEELIQKSDNFIKMYNVLAKWLKNTMKISICKNYYIGAHAYQLYKDKRCILQDGSKYYVEF